MGLVTSYKLYKRCFLKIKLIHMENKIPFFRPNNGGPTSINGTLYHFTSAESLFKILEDMTLTIEKI